MNSYRSDYEGMVNGFVESQRKSAVDGKQVLVRLATFDDRLELVHELKSVHDVKPFVLTPRGMTALHDAMGTQIVAFGEELAAFPEEERPGNVVFVLLTDGYENASREYDKARVRELIEKQRKDYAWNVVYLSADENAINEAASYGVARGSAMSYTASSGSLRSMTGTMDSYVAVASTGIAPEFSEEDREGANAED